MRLSICVEIVCYLQPGNLFTEITSICFFLVWYSEEPRDLSLVFFKDNCMKRLGALLYALVQESTPLYPNITGTFTVEVQKMT